MTFASIEILKLLARLPGPHAGKTLFSTYRAVERVCEAEMRQPGVTALGQTLLVNSKHVLTADLYKVRCLLQSYVEMIMKVLRTSKGGEERAGRIALNIMAQIVSLPSNFVVLDEERWLKGRISVETLTLHGKYKEVQKDLSPFADLVWNQNVFPEEAKGMSMWVTALHYLQNFKGERHFEFMWLLVQQVLNRFDVDVFDKRRAPTLFVAIDILELFVWSHRSDPDDVQIGLMNSIQSQLIILADEKVPGEGSPQYKRLSTYKQYGYERIICGLVQLCLLMSASARESPNVKCMHNSPAL